jgi:hypothetical protein
MSKLKLLIAFALGYVAGAAAGRQRYESIKSGAQKVANDPRVQSAAKKVGTTVAEQAPVVAEAVKEKTTAAASAVADKVSGSDDQDAQPPAAPTGTPLS